MPTPYYPNNLVDIFTSPSISAQMMAREQFANAAQNDKLAQQKALQDYLYQEQENPLKLMQQQLTNDTVSAQLPGVAANSRSLVNKADVEDATKASTIDAKNSGNKKQISSDQADMLNNFGQQMGQLADYVAGGGSLLAIQDQVPSNILQMLQQPGGIQKAKALSEKIALGYNDYKQKNSLQQAELSSREREGAANRANALEIAKLRGAGKGGGSKSPADLMASAKNPRELYTKALLAMQNAETPEEQAAYAKIMDSAAAAWETEMKNVNKGGLDIAATANSGNIVAKPPVDVPRSNSAKPQVKKDAQGRILLD